MIVALTLSLTLLIAQHPTTVLHLQHSWPEDVDRALNYLDVTTLQSWISGLDSTLDSHLQDWQQKHGMRACSIDNDNDDLIMDAVSQLFASPQR